MVMMVVLDVMRGRRRGRVQQDGRVTRRRRGRRHGNIRTVSVQRFGSGFVESRGVVGAVSSVLCRTSARHSDQIVKISSIQNISFQRRNNWIINSSFVKFNKKLLLRQIKKIKCLIIFIHNKLNSLINILRPILNNMQRPVPFKTCPGHKGDKRLIVNSWCC